VRRALGLLLLLCGRAAAVDGQTPAGPPPAARRAWTVGPYVGISRHSPVGSIWGLTPDRKHVLIGLHATFPIVRGTRWVFAYAPEAIPLIVVSNNPTYVQGPGELIEVGRGPVAGAGIAPIGLELDVAATRRLSVYTAGSMGGLWFTRHVPVAEARSFNFTFDFGGGVLVRVGRQTRLRAGYKFHHLSNAKTAPSNPGIDAKVFLIGVERSLGSSAAAR
jgi:hypothetical protein